MTNQAYSVHIETTDVRSPRKGMKEIGLVSEGRKKDKEIRPGCAQRPSGAGV